jgi:hypothetical protein
MREFAGVSDAAARQANITKRRIGEARNNDVLAGRNITTHEPAQDSLADMIRAVNARRRRLTP